MSRAWEGSVLLICKILIKWGYYERAPHGQTRRLPRALHPHTIYPVRTTDRVCLLFLLTLLKLLTCFPRSRTAGVAVYGLFDNELWTVQRTNWSNTSAPEQTTGTESYSVLAGPVCQYRIGFYSEHCSSTCTNCILLFGRVRTKGTGRVVVRNRAYN